MESDDSEIADLLDNLLADSEEPDDESSTKKSDLCNTEINFMDQESNTPVDRTIAKPTETLIHHGDTDSSDDEDKRDFEHQKYSECGREVKALFKSTSSNHNTLFSNTPPPSNQSFRNKPAKELCCPVDPVKKVSQDVYCDPIFGLRIINPLISSTTLKDRMTGRKAVTISNVRNHLTTQDLANDWVIAGVVIQKSPVRKSQKGSHFSIWKVSDLSDKIKSISLFLFSGAHKEFWKTATGTVIGILNPGVLDNKDENQNEATLSVDNPQKIMLLGVSKDMGICKSKKKNGDPCTAVVNLHRCEYCVYHVRQEYNKCARRMDLQSSTSGRSLATPKGLKNNSIDNGNAMWESRNFTSVPARQNRKLVEKDRARLQLLRQRNPTEAIVQSTSNPAASRKASLVELTTSQTKKDTERLKMLRGSIPMNEPLSLPLPVASSPPALSIPRESNVKCPIKSPELKTDLTRQLNSTVMGIPRLGGGLLGSTIDLSEPINKNRMDMAKINAIKWIQRNGSIKKGNPNMDRRARIAKTETAVKRRREESPDAAERAKKQNTLATRFKEVMNATSKHQDLVDNADEQAKEKYFNKLEVKEKMEEKMMTTFKVDCKAVTCLVCKYTAFSASDSCKELRHPLRVTDGTKRFFKCGNCKNRTTTLDKLPSYTCQNCQGSNWIRAAMMDERRIELPGASLCIRGGEEQFIGSNVKDGSLNLLVPDCD